MFPVKKGVRKIGDKLTLSKMVYSYLKKVLFDICSLLMRMARGGLFERRKYTALISREAVPKAKMGEIE